MLPSNDPYVEAAEAEYAERRTRMQARPVFTPPKDWAACVHCGQTVVAHLSSNEYCPEWALREAYGK